MTDNDLIKAFKPIIEAGLASNNITECPVLAANQPTRQGVAVNKAVYFTKLNDVRYGFVKRADVYDPELAVFEHTETQPYESTFQINAMSIQSVNNTSDLTASDLVNLVASIMQSDYARDELRKEGIGIIRVTDVRNPYFLNDKDRYQASPSFDFTLLYNRTLVNSVGAVNSYEHVIKRV